MTTSSGVNGALVLWGSIDVCLVNEDELNDWWMNEHLPERLQIPGFLRARRFRGINVEGKNPSYLALYEVDEPGVLVSDAYMHALDHPTPRTKLFMPHLARMNRSGCFVVGSKRRHPGIDTVGNLLFCATFQSTSPSKVAMDSFVLQMSRRIFGLHPKVLNVHLLRHDDEFTNKGNSSNSYASVKFDSEPLGQGLTKFIALLDVSESSTSTENDTSQALEKDFVKSLEMFKEGLMTSWKGYKLLCAFQKDRSW